MANITVTSLVKPQRLWSRGDILVPDCPVPREAGVYAWYFKELPPTVPAAGCVTFDGATLLYVGISPTKPASNGRPPSQERLVDRIQNHLRGNASGSTLRLTLGCLLADTLHIELRRVGSGNRRTFGAGEDRLSEWMHENARVVWATTPEPWLFERRLIGELSLPLNLQHNQRHPFHPILSANRRKWRQHADRLPVRDETNKTL